VKCAEFSLKNLFLDIELRVKDPKNYLNHYLKKKSAMMMAAFFEAG